MAEFLFEPILCDPTPARPRLRGGWRSMADIIPYPSNYTPPAASSMARRVNLLAQRVGFLPGTLGQQHTAIMGIVNVTPDSFSDGGQHADPDAAIAHGLALARAGADLLDVGGESTRPGAPPVDPQEEIRRVVPVIRGLAERGLLLSVDTRHAVVMEAALAAGARIINDVTALEGDPASVAVAARSGAPVILMHMRGPDPRTMQNDPSYGDVVTEVYRYLGNRVAVLEAAGIAKARLCVDPGIGFGKTPSHNLALLRHLQLLHGLGCAVLLGASRKRFISAVSADEPPQDRLGGSITAAITAFAAGVQIVRVHDVAETAQARAVWFATHA